MSLYTVDGVKVLAASLSDALRIVRTLPAAPVTERTPAVGYGVSTRPQGSR